MSTARKTRTVTRKVATPAPTTTAANNILSLMPTFSSVANTQDANCNCSNCCRPTTTVCLTFDMSFLQNLINMFPKVNISSGNTCNDNPDCQDQTTGQ